MRARNGALASPRGGGTRSTIASRMSGMPMPSLAETKMISSWAKPNAWATSWATRSGSATSRSILLMTGMISRSCSRAR